MWHSLSVKHKAKKSSGRPASKWHSRTIKHNTRKLSGQRNTGSKKGKLTSYRTRREGVVRTARQGQWESDTYRLSRAEQVNRQDSKIESVNEGTHKLSRAERGSHQDGEIEPISTQVLSSIEGGSRE